MIQSITENIHGAANKWKYPGEDKTQGRIPGRKKLIPRERGGHESKTQSFFVLLVTTSNLKVAT